nr:hypothetical protein [uncultured Flavobacterium sp.]
MKTTQFILTFLLSMTSLSLFSQTNYGKPKDSINFKTEINSDFFILGTLSDYMGRFQYVDRKNQIDRYYPYEEPITKYIAKFINENYKIVVDTVFKTSRHSEFFSSKLAKEIHTKYFDEKGSFIDSTLNSEVKKYSFLTGVYYRYGEHLEGNIYKIQIANSPKDKEIYQILKDLECDKLTYNFLRGYIPSSDIFYFEATPRMIKYFNTVKKEKEELQKSYYEKIFKGIYSSEKGDELKKKDEEIQNELIKSLKFIFK